MPAAEEPSFPLANRRLARRFRFSAALALAGVAMTGCAWLGLDMLEGSTFAPGLAEPGWASQVVQLLRFVLAAGLIACSALTFYLMRSNWRLWHGQRLAAERSLRRRLERIQTQFDAVGRVGLTEALMNGDVEALAREITETAANTVGCERVTIWRFNETETELHCVDLYEASLDRHSKAQTMYEHEFRDEFEALKTLRYISADDAASDPRTAAYLESYIEPFGITSMLDTVIRVSGVNLGVICFEHVRTPHRWQQDEIAFAGHLADQFAFGVMNGWRREAEARLRASEASLADAQSVANVGSWELDIADQALTWSAETYRIFGVDPKAFVPSVESVLARIHPDDREHASASYTNSIGSGRNYTSSYRVQLENGDTRTILERGRTFVRNGEPYRSVGTVQDITLRKAAEEALELRDRIFHAITIGTTLMLKEDSLELGMSAALGVLGRAIDVDRVLVIEKPDQTSPPVRLRYFWEADEAGPCLGKEGFAQVKVLTETIAGWHAPLAEGKAVVTHLLETEGDLRSLFEQTGSKSILLMPIFVEERLWGTIGIHACKSERNWTTLETETLATFSSVIGSLLQREITRAELETSEARFRAVSETARDAIVLIDSHGRAVYWNQATERLLGYSPSENETKPIQDWLVPPRYCYLLEAELAELAALSSVSSAGKKLEISAVCRERGEVPAELSIAGMRLAEEWYAVGILRDISERKQAEQMILQLAHTDELTGLANRRTFVAAVQNAIARARRNREGFAVLYLDLDHFKDVNDVLGHPVGDELIKRVAETLKGSVRQTDTVARFGGDEFAVLASEVKDPTGLAVLSTKLISALHEPFEVQDNIIRTGASLGIAIYGPDSADAESLLAHADIALYRAKQEGRGIYKFFTESMDIEVRERVQLAAELREAIAQSKLALVYQPQVDIASGRIVGLEALLRWQHPELGFVPPDKFVATAETSGQITALGRWVMETSFRQVRQWLDEGLEIPSIAVNFSPLQFRSALELEQDIADILNRYGLQPDILEIELTETALMETSREYNELLQRIRDKGCKLAIDDFGTGYSSLDYLRHLPVDRIKIDRSFISKITTDQGDATIVKAAINIAHDFGLTVIAEGVETAEELAMLKTWGCNEVQGYYFARPMAPEDLYPLLVRRFLGPAAQQVASAS